jgi:hypothetical protein
LFAGGEACPPLLGVTTPMPDCRAFNDAVMAPMKDARIRDVILESRWAKYAEGTAWGVEPKGHPIVLHDDACTSGETARDNHAVFARGLWRTLGQLRALGKNIVIVAGVPEIGWPVPAVLARRALARDRTDVNLPLHVYMRRQKFVLATFDRIHRQGGARVLYPHRILCAGGTCDVALNGIPLYRDEHHLSVFGARQLTPLMRGAF